MSAFSSIFPNIRRPQPSSLPSQPDQLSDLRFALEVMPGSRKYVFTPGARAEILTKLYSSFLGNYPQLFLEDGAGKVPQHMLLSEHQISTSSRNDSSLVPGRPCTHIFKKGECCFRCKCVDIRCLSIHFTDPLFTETAHWTIVAFSAPDVSMPQIIQIIM